MRKRFPRSGVFRAKGGLRGEHTTFDSGCRQKYLYVCNNEEIFNGRAAQVGGSLEAKENAGKKGAVPRRCE